MVITLVNNAGSAFVKRTKSSNGLEIQLSLPPSKLQPMAILTALNNPNTSSPIITNSQGSSLILSNRNYLLSYGQIPVSREYGPNHGSNSDVLWEARYGEDNLVQNYRMFKQEWKATATRTTLSVSVEESGDGCYFSHVSWNGATCIKAWDVYEGSERTMLKYVGRVEFKGFETRLIIGGPMVQVVAIMEDGKEYKSEIVTT